MATRIRKTMKPSLLNIGAASLSKLTNSVGLLSIFTTEFAKIDHPISAFHSTFTYTDSLVSGYKTGV